METKRLSTTFFANGKGDETADYSYNYKTSGTGAGVDVKTVSINFYDIANISGRASDMTAAEIIDAKMLRSDSFRAQD